MPPSPTFSATWIRHCSRSFPTSSKWPSTGCSCGPAAKGLRPITVWSRRPWRHRSNGSRCDTPVLIAIDNVQWLDPSSQAVISFAARRFSGRVGILVTERCDADSGTSAVVAAPRPGRMASTALRVSALSLGGLHALISARLGRTFARPTMVRIAEISGGNPFYALELARAIDMGSANAHSRLPGTLAELMRMRIGELDPGVKDLLLAAASVATPTVELLAQVTGTTSSELQSCFRRGTKPRASSRLTAIRCGSLIRCWRAASTPMPVPPSAGRCTGRWPKP